MNEKLIKEMSKEEMRQYRHEHYLRHRKKRLEEAGEYYNVHKEEILLKAKNRYRIKCGLQPLKGE